MGLIELSFEQRLRLGEKLRGSKLKVIEAVTADFFLRHPDLRARYGERGVELTKQDAEYHIDFLAGAVDSGSMQAFEHYVNWAARVLLARGIQPAFLTEFLKQLGTAACATLDVTECRAVERLIEAACQACTGSNPVRESGGTSPLAQAQSVFLGCLLQGQRKAACGVAFEAMREGCSISDIYLDILQESMFQVGRLWESNQISVAQEHMATAITQFVMATLYPAIELAPAHKGKIIITGVEGEMHQLGANMVSDVLEADGYSVQFLGTNVPPAGVLELVEKNRPDVVGISATMLFNIPKVVHLVSRIKESVGEDGPKIILGGAAFRFAPDLPNELGALGWAGELRGALAVLQTP